MKLPEKFTERMHQYFEKYGRSDEEPSFWSSYEKDPVHGIRWNRLKMDPSEYGK
jgi:hypothetical protein